MCSAAARAVRLVLLIFRAPYEAAGGWREGPAGVAGTEASHFSPGQEPRRKARNPHAYLSGFSPIGASSGGPFFGLLFFGQAKKSDSPSGRRAKRPPRRRPGRDHATTKRYRYWTPGLGRGDGKDEAIRRAPNPLPKREREQKSSAPLLPHRLATPKNTPTKPRCIATSTNTPTSPNPFNQRTKQPKHPTAPAQTVTTAPIARHPRHSGAYVFTSMNRRSHRRIAGL
jgi:hypothetical protein